MRKILSAFFFFASVAVASAQIGPPPGSSGGGGTPGGANGSIQFNNSGTFGGRSPLLASDLPVVNHPGYKLGVWYLPVGAASGNTQGSGGPALLTAYCLPVQIGGNSSATIQALGLNVQTAGTTVQLAIYNNDFSSGIARPGTLVDSTTNITATSGGKLSANLNATHSIQPGFYWFCLQTDNTALRYLSVTSSFSNVLELAGSTNIGNTLGGSGSVSEVSTTTGISSFGTWPSFVGATFTEGFSSLGPMVGFKFASVP